MTSITKRVHTIVGLCTLNDSVMNEKTIAQMKEIKTDFEIQRQEAEIELLGQLNHLNTDEGISEGRPMIETAIDKPLTKQQEFIYGNVTNEEKNESDEGRLTGSIKLVRIRPSCFGRVSR